MSEEFDQTSRRRILKQFLGTMTTASALPILGQTPPPESHHSAAPLTKQAATAYKYQYFKPDQLKTLDALTETIIPTDEHSPGAKSAGVSEYIDAIVADAPEARKRLWDKGLALADHQAMSSFGKAYSDCSAEAQIAILQVMADEETSDSPEHFFGVLKRATIDGYYTSRIGIHEDLQYRGNEAMAEFPGCQRGETL